MTASVQTAAQPPVAAPRRQYTAPCLIVHGTMQTLTLNIGGVDGASSVDAA